MTANSAQNPKVFAGMTLVAEAAAGGASLTDLRDSASGLMSAVACISSFGFMQAAGSSVEIALSISAGRENESVCEGRTGGGNSTSIDSDRGAATDPCCGLGTATEAWCSQRVSSFRFMQETGPSFELALLISGFTVDAHRRSLASLIISATDQPGRENRSVWEAGCCETEGGN